MCYALKSTQNSDTLSGAYSLFVNQCDQEPAHLTTIPKDRTSKILKRSLFIYRYSIMMHYDTTDTQPGLLTLILN